MTGCASLCHCEACFAGRGNLIRSVLTFSTTPTSPIKTLAFLMQYLSLETTTACLAVALAKAGRAEPAEASAKTSAASAACLVLFSHQIIIRRGVLLRSGLAIPKRAAIKQTPRWNSGRLSSHRIFLF